MVQHRGDDPGGCRDLPAVRQGRWRRRRGGGAEGCAGPPALRRRRCAGAAPPCHGRGVLSGRCLQPGDHRLRRHRRPVLRAGAQVKDPLVRRRHLRQFRRVRQGRPAAVLRVARIVRQRLLLILVGYLSSGGCHLPRGCCMSPVDTSCCSSHLWYVV